MPNEKDFDDGWKRDPKTFKAKISEIKKGDSLKLLIERLGRPSVKTKTEFEYSSIMTSGYLCICAFKIKNGIVDQIQDKGCTHIHIQ